MLRPMQPTPPVVTASGALGVPACSSLRVTCGVITKAQLAGSEALRSDIDDRDRRQRHPAGCRCGCLKPDAWPGLWPSLPAWCIAAALLCRALARVSCPRVGRTGAVAQPLTRQRARSATCWAWRASPSSPSSRCSRRTLSEAHQEALPARLDCCRGWQLAAGLPTREARRGRAWARTPPSGRSRSAPAASGGATCSAATS